MLVEEEKKEVGDNDDDPEAIRACLNVELAKTSTGAKVFTALKGAVDGEREVSHSEKRFVGHDNKAESLKDVHRAHIFGQLHEELV